MKINFTSKQYEFLVKIVYLGNWLVNAIRIPGEEVEEFADIEEYVYEQSKEFKLDKLVRYDNYLKQHVPTMEMEDDPTLREYINEYNEENFWEELSFALGRRDFLKKHTRDEVNAMELEELIEKEGPFIDRYVEEFKDFGIQRLEVSG